MQIPFAVMERAASKYVEDPETGCWVSTYSTQSTGYAQVGWSGKLGRGMTLAHRAAWQYHIGIQLTSDETIDHLCRNRRCVNPNHLRVLSNFENARRTFGRDWTLGECINGHSNSLLRVTKSGKLECEPCAKERARRSNWKTRGVPQYVSRRWINYPLAA